MKPHIPILMILLILQINKITFANELIQSTTAKHEDIVQLLNVNGQDQLPTKVIHELKKRLKPNSARITLRFLKEFDNEASLNEIRERIISVYDKYLSHDDIKALIAFFQTPAGQAFVKMNPQIIEESTKIAMEWGNANAINIIEKMRDEGYFETENNDKIP